MRRLSYKPAKTVYATPHSDVAVDVTLPVAYPLFHEEIPYLDEDGSEQVAHLIRDDIYLLFNQRRLAKTLGLDTFNAYVDSLEASSNDPLRQLRSKCTDDQLMSMIKSRHIQNLCEMQAWSEYLNSKADELVGDAKKLFEEQQQQDEKDSSDPAAE